MRALELIELVEERQREAIRRDNPHLSEAEVEALMDAWYLEQPGAEHGDGEGRVVAWPRPKG